MPFSGLEMPEARRIKLLCGASFVLGLSFAFLICVTTKLLVVRARSSEPERLPRLGSSVAGPSGTIDAVEIPLAVPEEVFPDRAVRLRQPKWFFESFSESRLARFISSCDLRPVEKRMLLDTRCWSITATGIVVSPPEQLIWCLNHTSRKQIYAILAKSPVNFPQCFPFRFPLEGFDQKFKESGLPVEQVERIRRLTYTNANYICFTDLEALKACFKPDEFKELVETLYQLPTYLLRLRIPPEADTEALTKYWGKGGREKLIAPLLAALARVPGGTEVNVSYLLPTFARLRLYTYPYARNEPTAGKEDCFFTALNFFNETPNTNFFDAAYTARALQTDYLPVQNAPSFGDLVVLQDGGGQVFHSCVYIAADFVFTKNGVNPSQPWVLMKLSDMLMLYYPQDTSGKIRFLRRKDLA